MTSNKKGKKGDIIVIHSHLILYQKLKELSCKCVILLLYSRIVNSLSLVSGIEIY
ncbi:hypothetical protein Peur_045409 [Populus x canadensis]